MGRRVGGRVKLRTETFELRDIVPSIELKVRGGMKLRVRAQSAEITLEKYLSVGQFLIKAYCCTGWSSLDSVGFITSEVRHQTTPKLMSLDSEYE